MPAAGSTVILEPVPADVPPHDPVNHSQTAPVPREPPVTESTLLVPLQVLLLVIVTPVGAVEFVPTVTVKFPGVLFPQVFDEYTLMVPPDVPAVTEADLLP